MHVPPVARGRWCRAFGVTALKSMIKIVIFYGGVLLAIIGSFVLWFALPPRYRVEVMCDEAGRAIRCTVHVARSMGRCIQLATISMPTEYVQRLGASRPSGFKELKRYVAEHDNGKREVVVWWGRLELRKDHTIALSIPAEYPNAVSGTIQLGLECWGLAKVGCSYDTADVALKSKDA